MRSSDDDKPPTPPPMRARDSDKDIIAQAAYEAWLAAFAPGANHPWDVLDDEQRAGWHKIVEAVKGK